MRCEISGRKTKAPGRRNPGYNHHIVFKKGTFSVLLFQALSTFPWPNSSTLHWRQFGKIISFFWILIVPPVFFPARNCSVVSTQPSQSGGHWRGRSPLSADGIFWGAAIEGVNSYLKLRKVWERCWVGGGKKSSRRVLFAWVTQSVINCSVDWEGVTFVVGLS